MPYPATVIRVMVSSPSDCGDAQILARTVIDDWNAAHSSEQGLYLAAVGWGSHAAPEMGDRPQEIINKQVLRDCDLLIAVFWTRLGTPTGKASSGTVEEIEEHLNARRPVMLYFSEAPLPLRLIDEAQHKALREFRASCEARGLIDTFDSLDEFREKLARQLAQTVNREFRQSRMVGAGTGGSASDALPDLSDTAKHLLSEAARDSKGYIFFCRSMTSLTVQTNGKQLAEAQDARSEARWRAAMDELVRGGLLEARGVRGEVFAVTRAGFDLADRLAASPGQP